METKSGLFEHPEVTLHARENMRVQRNVLGAGILIFLIKMLAWILTGSNSVLTDALESWVNLTAGAIGLYSLYLSAQPRDANHPYGHGKVEWISASLEGGMIMAAGVLVIFKAVYNFFFPVTLSALDVGLYLVGLAGFCNGLMGYLSWRRGKRVHSVTLQASGKHLMSDAWSTVGLVIGLLLVLWTGKGWLDNVVAILFGLYIAYSGFGILRKSIAGIMDEMDETLLGRLGQRLEELRTNQLIDIHNLRIIQYGNLIHVDCHITAPWYLNVLESHHLVAYLESALGELDGRPVEWFIHVDACHEGSCRICTLTECPVRKQSFEKRLDWNASSLILNKNHGRYEVLP